MRTIYFDMDGTIANFYGVDGWLEDLRNGGTKGYDLAKPLIKMNVLARKLNALQRDGYHIGIISWGSKFHEEEHFQRITESKEKWLKKHLKSVAFDEIHIIPYGTPKEMFCNGNDILFDDEKPNREHWNGLAYDETHIMEVLREL